MKPRHACCCCCFCLRRQKNASLSLWICKLLASLGWIIHPCFGFKVGGQAEREDERELNSGSVSLPLGRALLLSSNQFPSMPPPLSRGTKIISDIRVRKRKFFTCELIPRPKNRHSSKKKKRERAGWRRSWLFSTVLVIFLAFLLPSDNICVNSRQFYYKPTQLEGSGRGKKGQPLRESCILSAVVSHKERLLFEVVSTDFKSLLLWWR